MKERTWSATNKHARETKLRIILHDSGPLKGGMGFEIGLQQRRDHPRGALIGPSVAAEVLRWISENLPGPIPRNGQGPSSA
jgi:hypothetical protein